MQQLREQHAQDFSGLSSREQEVAQLTTRCADLAHANAAAKQQHQLLRQQFAVEADRLQREVVDVSLQLEQALSQLSGSADVISELQAQNAELTDALGELQQGSQTATQADEAAHHVLALQRDVDVLQQERHEALERAQQLAAQASALEHMVGTERSAKAVLEQRCQQLESELVLVQGQLDEQREVAGLSDRVTSDLSARAREADKLQLVAAQLDQELRAEQSRLASLQLSHTAHVAKLQDRAAQAQARIGGLEDELRKSLLQQRDTMERLIASRDAIAQLAAEQRQSQPHAKDAPSPDPALLTLCRQQEAKIIELLQDKSAMAGVVSSKEQAIAQLEGRVHGAEAALERSRLSLDQSAAMHSTLKARVRHCAVARHSCFAGRRAEDEDHVRQVRGRRQALHGAGAQVPRPAGRPGTDSRRSRHYHSPERPRHAGHPPDAATARAAGGPGAAPVAAAQPARPAAAAAGGHAAGDRGLPPAHEAEAEMRLLGVAADAPHLEQIMRPAIILCPLRWTSSTTRRAVRRPSSRAS